MEKAYKYRIYPNKKQKEIIAKTFGCCRFVYNTYLAKRIEIYEKDKTTFTYVQCANDMKNLKAELEWLKEVDSTALQSSLRDLDFAYQKKGKGTVRQLIWKKTNPSPMNGQHIYLSGIENAVWFKKRGGTFNAHCKNTVFAYPCGRSKLHPTEKNHDLIKELILDNSNEGDIIFDPCAGSGSHLLVAKENNRKWLGMELSNKYFAVASEKLGE